MATDRRDPVLDPLDRLEARLREHAAPAETFEPGDLDELSARIEAIEQRPPQQTAPEIHVHVAPTPSRPDSEPPRSFRDRLRRPSPVERLVAALVAGGAALAGALEALRVLGEAMRR